MLELLSLLLLLVLVLVLGVIVVVVGGGVGVGVGVSVAVFRGGRCCCLFVINCSFQRTHRHPEHPVSALILRPITEILVQQQVL